MASACSAAATAAMTYGLAAAEADSGGRAAQKEVGLYMGSGGDERQKRRDTQPRELLTLAAGRLISS